MSAPDDVMAVLMTAPDIEVAERLGHVAVEERLAACANVLPGVTSIYLWEGSVQRDAEVLVIFKTTAGGLDALRRRVVDMHPYDVPELIALPVSGGHGPYLDWVRGEVDA